jgi:hypothetical protein
MITLTCMVGERDRQALYFPALNPHVSNPIASALTELLKPVTKNCIQLAFVLVHCVSSHLLLFSVFFIEIIRKKKIIFFSLTEISALFSHSL